VRNPAEYPVLGILNLGHAHGYDICRRLREGIGCVWRLGKSQVYALLARMEREGLLTHERVGQENLPARNIFTLTPKGREVFREWLETPVRHIRDFRLEFLTKLWFARNLGPNCEKDLINRQLLACREKVRAIEEMRAASSTAIESHSVAFKLAIIQAAIGWLEGLLAEAEDRV
jgi:DNA-binding PadR family transcriptional regulator